MIDEALKAKLAKLAEIVNHKTMCGMDQALEFCNDFIPLVHLLIREAEIALLREVSGALTIEARQHAALVRQGVLIARDVVADLWDKARPAALSTPLPPELICEVHPWLSWPHDQCAGPGMPRSAQAVELARRDAERVKLLASVGALQAEVGMWRAQAALRAAQGDAQ